MRLQIVHGVQRYNLDLPDSSNGQSEEHVDAQGQDWSIKTLKEEIAKLTGVPVEGQRLIRKGSTILGDDKPLSSLNLASGEKIMVLGNKTDLAEDPAMKSLKTIETTILDGIEGKIKAVDERLQGIHEGFLTKELVPPALNELSKQLKVLAEDCMKTLELMDSMKLSDDFRDQARAKRKMLVLRVQALLQWHDALLEKLEEVSSELSLKGQLAF